MLRILLQCISSSEMSTCLGLDMHVFVYVGHVNVKKFVYAKDERKNQFVGQPRDQNLFRDSSSLCRIKM